MKIENLNVKTCFPFIEITVAKRTFTGPDDNIITSKYMKSHKYAVVALLADTSTHYGGVYTQTFRTKKEADNCIPIHASKSFSDNAKAKEYYDNYIAN